MKDHQWQIAKRQDAPGEATEKRRRLEYPDDLPGNQKKTTPPKVEFKPLPEATYEIDPSGRRKLEWRYGKEVEVTQNPGLPKIIVTAGGTVSREAYEARRPENSPPATAVNSGGIVETGFHESTPRERQTNTAAAAYRKALVKCAEHLELLGYGDLTKNVPKAVEGIAKFRKMVRRQVQYLPTVEDAQKALIKCAIALNVPNNGELAKDVPKAVKALVQGARKPTEGHFSKAFDQCAKLLDLPGTAHPIAEVPVAIKAMLDYVDFLEKKVGRKAMVAPEPNACPELARILESEAYKTVEKGSATYGDRTWLYKEITDWLEAFLGIKSLEKTTSDRYLEKVTPEQANREIMRRLDTLSSFSANHAERLRTLEKLICEHTNEITELREAMK